jgi:hypothetical protein
MLKTFIGALAVALCVVGSSARAQVEVKPMTAAEIATIKADVIKAANQYLVYFSNADAKSVAEKSYGNPAVGVGPKGISGQDRATVEKSFGNSFVNLKKIGWVKSVFIDPTVCVLNPNVAFLSSKYNRYDKDNKVIAELNETLVYLRDSDGWKIVGNYAMPLGKVVACND